MLQEHPQERTEARHTTRRSIVLLASCFSAMLATLLFALSRGGTFTFSFSDLYAAFFHNDPELSLHQIFNEMRLPISINTLLYGAAIACAGVLLQRATRFTAVCPSSLGLVQAGILAMTVAIHIFASLSEWGAFLVSIGGAGCGLLLASLCSLLIPVKATGMRRLVGGLVAAGIIGVTLFLYLIISEMESMELMAIQKGIFRTRLEFIPIELIGIILSIFLTSRMRGSPHNDSTWQVVSCYVLATVLTGTAIMTLGSWAMAGLIASAIARWLAGKESRILMPVAAMIGAIIVSALNTLSYFIFPPFEISIEMVTGLAGLPILVVLIWKEAIGYVHTERSTKN